MKKSQGKVREFKNDSKKVNSYCIFYKLQAVNYVQKNLTLKINNYLYKIFELLMDENSYYCP